MSQSAADKNRTIENLLSIGTIAAVDYGAVPPQVCLDIAGRTTGWMPVPADIGRNFRRWRPLRVGTQVLAACLSGDPAQAIIIQIMYTTAGATPLPPPEVGEAVDVIQWDDGTLIRYDSAAHKMRVLSVGDLSLEAPNGTIVVDGKNLVLRTGEDGYFHTDNAGRATRLTHKGGSAFENESWTTGSDATAKPDHGFHPPKVTSPGETG
ncbi:MAG: phage baseplate assembly protein V [Rhodospirillaceae bacterium]|nr:phage baseplate assembly protein V [Rhodospirillales bacterium]